MNDIVIENNTRYKVEDITNTIISKFLDYLELSNVSMFINFVTVDEIININSQYRSLNLATDVITFSYEDVDNFNELFDVRELGDIFICLDKVISNSIEIGNTIGREFCFVLAHGLLHTLGYDHDNIEEETKMFELQETLIQSVIDEGSEVNAIFSK